MLAKRIDKLSESITIAITALAQELKAEGKTSLVFQPVNRILIRLELSKMLQ